MSCNLDANKNISLLDDNWYNLSEINKGVPKFQFKAVESISQDIMSKIYCVKLKKEAEALDYQPYPGAVGEKIVANISAEAWDLWVNHQTMLINEMRLTPVDPKARKLLEDEMEKFLFGEGSAKPEGYTPEK